MSTNAQRLAQAVRARRDDLDLSQLDVWQAGGPSNTTLTEVENGRVERLTRTTARRLDMGLKWEAGSARRVWEGGEATLAGRREVDPAGLRRRIETATGLNADDRAALLKMLDDRERGGGEGARDASAS